MDFGLESGDTATAEQLVFDYRNAAIDPAERALCDYAVKLTLHPTEVGPADLDLLRGHGFEDDAIVVAVQVIGYFNHINRIADALGVEDEPWMTPPRDEWLARKGTGYGA